MHSRIVVADSSVLISLGKADCLYILKDLYGEIIVPPSVFAEAIVKWMKHPSVLSDPAIGSM